MPTRTIPGVHPTLALHKDTAYGRAPMSALGRRWSPRGPGVFSWTRPPPNGGRVQGIALLVAAVGNALVGVWAALDPSSFYKDFPGDGHHWVSTSGPYDQHLVVDVGSLSLALTVTLLAAFFHREKILVRTASISALVFAMPHLWFHAIHRDGLSTSDASAELVSLALMVVAPLVALTTTFFNRAELESP